MKRKIGDERRKGEFSRGGPCFLRPRWGIMWENKQTDRIDKDKVNDKDTRGGRAMGKLRLLIAAVVVVLLGSAAAFLIFGGQPPVEAERFHVVEIIL